MPAAHPPIPLQDYQRIFRVLKSVLDCAGTGAVHSSTFFSVAGAQVLEKHYKKKCQPVAGAAVYKVDDAAQTAISLSGGPAQGGRGAGAEEGFHCWIVCDGWIIDFMAPLFVEQVRPANGAGRFSRKMFQKPIDAMSDSPLLMKKPGDFYMLPDVDLTRDVLERFFSDDGLKDMVQICMHWYRKPPRGIPRQLSVQTQAGTTIELTLAGPALDGVW